MIEFTEGIEMDREIGGSTPGLFRSCIGRYQTEHLSKKSCSRSNLEEFRGRDGSLERGRITEENSAALTIAGLPYFIRSRSSTNTLSKWV